MAQQYITSAFDPNFTTLQHQTSIHYKSSPIEMIVPMQCNQNQATLSITPVHISPFVNISDSNNHNLTNIVEPVSSNTMSPAFKSDDMPTLSSYPGPYNFQIFIPNGEFDESKRKGQTCVFQTDKMGNHQLFTKPHPHYWRLNYSADPSMSTENMYIRMVPVFGDPEKAQCILERCAKHKEVTTDENHWKYRSMLIVEKTCAHYFQDSATKRVCILLPFEKHAEGEIYSSVNCQFACYNSCFNQDSGGRKTLYLIITLEFLDKKTNKFDVWGRQCLQFRSCACPSRDWRDKKIKGDPEMLLKFKEKRIKTEEKLNNLVISKSVPINMGGKDAIIRVLPSLPGLDDAINALVCGYLLNRTTNISAIIAAFNQMKDVEHLIIDQFTSNLDQNTCDSKSPSQTPESQISPNTSNLQFNDYGSLYGEPCQPYRPMHQQVVNNFSSPGIFSKIPFETYPVSYDIKLSHEMPQHFDELPSDNYNRH
uniref:SMED-P53 n=1 Tax=Schmidtea mediterranea TaxID=79327 RepID=B9ZV22_SCHMD|nr:SMED-P53 [Schmidtea mediterranea]